MIHTSIFSAAKLQTSANCIKVLAVDFLFVYSFFRRYMARSGLSTAASSTFSRIRDAVESSNERVVRRRIRCMAEGQG